MTAAARRRRPVTPGAESRLLDPDQLHGVAGEIAALREQLRAVPVDDRAGWASVAHDSAGVFAAWSTRLETQPGPLAATAAELTRSAQLHAAATARRTPAAARGTGARRAAALLQASGATSERTGELLLLRQLGNTVKALHDAHQATGCAQAADGLAALARGELVDIHYRYVAAAEHVPGGPALDISSRSDRSASASPRSAGQPPRGTTRSAAGQRLSEVEQLRSAPPLPPPLPRGWTAASGHTPPVIGPGADPRPGSGLGRR